MKTFSRIVTEFFKDDDLFLKSANGSEEIDKREAETERLCMSRVFDQFLKTGSREDAFCVYFAFMEVCRAFGKKTGYDKVKTLLETLSEFEETAGLLLERHRDHYSHSVYVFSLGLMLYHRNKAFREAFCQFYQTEGVAAKSLFLYAWGMTSLFHDIGYPYELAFEQIKAYGRKLDLFDGEVRPTVAYPDVKAFAEISEADKQKFDLKRIPESANELLAWDIHEKFGLDYERLLQMIEARITSPDQKPKEARFMDHAYFSSVILLKTLLRKTDENCKIGNIQRDILSAIFLHNNFYRFEVKRAFPDAYHQVGVSQHPLAYLLLLCDELQCWDREAFGTRSREEELPWDIYPHLNNHTIGIQYKFERLPVRQNEAKPTKFEQFNADYGEKICREIVDIREIGAFAFSAEIKPRVRAQEKRLSMSSFYNLYEFAVAIHTSYLQGEAQKSRETIREEFSNLSLEYKLSNIEQAKSYAEKLERISCCYSDRNLNLERVDAFSDAQLNMLARMEHRRWIQEKLAMGWRYGTPKSLEERTKLRIHKAIVPYDTLDEGYKKTNLDAMKNMLNILNVNRKGVHIYKIKPKTPKKIKVAFTGHRMINVPIESKIEEMRLYLKRLKSEYLVTGCCQFALGTDLIFAKVCYDLDIPVVALLPKPYERYLEEDFDPKDRTEMATLYAQAESCRVETDEEFGYKNAADVMVDWCDQLLVMWDGVPIPLEDRGKLINQGGTYYTYKRAQGQGKHAEVFLI